MHSLYAERRRGWGGGGEGGDIINIYIICSLRQNIEW